VTLSKCSSWAGHTCSASNEAQQPSPELPCSLSVCMQPSQGSMAAEQAFMRVAATPAPSSHTRRMVFLYTQAKHPRSTIRCVGMVRQGASRAGPMLADSSVASQAAWSARHAHLGRNSPSLEDEHPPRRLASHMRPVTACYTPHLLHGVCSPPRRLHACQIACCAGCCTWMCVWAQQLPAKQHLEQSRAFRCDWMPP
jgi:hypothetical protein